MMSDFDFEDLVGEEFDFFYGATERFFKLDDVTYEVLEDGEVVIAEGPNLPTFGLPIARVIVECDDTIFKLIDLHDEHCWLRIGIEIHDTNERSYDSLPIFDYTPKDLEYV